VSCDQVREALSAGIDGEAAALSPEHTAEHLRDCAACRDWQDLAHTVTREVRLRSAHAPSDLATRILAATERDARQRRNRRYWIAVFCGVAVAGLIQLLATVPLLVLARSESSGSDASHLLGVAEALIGAAFFVGALVVLWKTRTDTTLELVRIPQVDRTEALGAVADEVA
jgi:predicted anti-sigma-YlaC factor YlaD